MWEFGLVIKGDIEWKEILTKCDTTDEYYFIYESLGRGIWEMFFRLAIG
jgi:hypothetical protein